MGIANDKLVKAVIEHDAELKKHVSEHEQYEKKLAEFQKRKYLNPKDEAEKKKLQKLKLLVKDKIEAILEQYRKNER